MRGGLGARWAGGVGFTFTQPLPARSLSAMVSADLCPASPVEDESLRRRRAGGGR